MAELVGALSLATDLGLGQPQEHVLRQTVLARRLAAAGGRLLLCPICFNAKQLAADQVVSNADLGGTVQLWEWIGDGATTFSF